MRPFIVFSVKLLVLSTLAIALLVSSFDQKAQAASNTKDELISPVLRLAYRIESVSQSNFTNNALAGVADIHIGLKTKNINGFKALIEFETLQNTKIGTFNSTTNGESDYPVVKDPTATELNRVWLEYSQENFNFKLGRQRVDLGNGRFVGSARFRLNEQTYDAAQLTFSPTKNLKIWGVWITKTHRVIGDDHPKGNFSGDTKLIHAQYNFFHNKKLSSQLQGYAYFFDFDEAPANSLSVWGGRYNLKNKTSFGHFEIAGEFANQKDYANNPNDIDLNYYSLSAKIKYGKFNALVGQETLKGDGQNGFQTPLARKHGFLGLADLFGSTPKDGINDLFFSAGFNPTNTAPFKSTRLDVTYHKYTNYLNGEKFGHEWNSRIRTKLIETVNLEIVLANFKSNSALPDVNKFWLYLKYHF